MANQMSVNQAIKILESNGDIIIKVSKNTYERTYPCDPARTDKKDVKSCRKRDEVFFKDIISARELIRLARMYTSESRSSTAMKKNLKEADNSKNRAATKRAIAHEDFDSLSPKHRAKLENPYNWD